MTNYISIIMQVTVTQKPLWQEFEILPYLRNVQRPNYLLLNRETHSALCENHSKLSYNIELLKLLL